MARQPAEGSMDDYIADFPPEMRDRLEQVRAIVRAAAPEATETISYAMPTFDLGGTHLVHFAGYANHVGLYPLPEAIEHFAPELARYRSGKGSVRFPNDEPLPAELIARIVEWRITEMAARQPGGRGTKSGRS